MMKDAEGPPRDRGPSRTKLFVVDRREEGLLVVVDDENVSMDVEAGRLPKSCRAEGAVLRVPLDDDGVPMWEDARRNRAEERRRIAELSKRVERLRRSDPGGDIVL